MTNNNTIDNMLFAIVKSSKKPCGHVFVPELIDVLLGAPHVSGKYNAVGIDKITQRYTFCKI